MPLPGTNWLQVTPAADIQSELIAEYVNAAPSIRTFFEGSLKLNRHFRVSEDVTSNTSSGIYPIKILSILYFTMAVDHP